MHLKVIGGGSLSRLSMERLRAELPGSLCLLSILFFYFSATFTCLYNLAHLYQTYGDGDGDGDGRDRTGME